MKDFTIDLTCEQERLLYVRAIAGSEITHDIETYCKNFYTLRKNNCWYEWVWNIDKLNKLPNIMLRGIYWSIHSDEL